MTLEELEEIDLYIENYKVTYVDENTNLTYLLRNHVVSKIRDNQGVGNKEIKVSKKVFFRLLKSMMTTLPKLLFLNKIVWVFSNAERRKKINDVYVDRVTSIVGHFNPSTLYIENPVLTNHKRPTNDIVFSDAFFYFLSFIFSGIYYRRTKVKVTGSVKEIESKYNISLNLEPKIKRYIGQYRAMKWILKIYKPKAIFMAYPNGYSGYIRAFKENHIPVVELQHGIIYPLHISYNCSFKQDLSIFKPDYILTYGTRDNQCLESIGYLKADGISTVGSYALWLYRSGNVPISEYLADELAEVSESKKTVAVSATVNDLKLLYNLLKNISSITSDYHFFLLPRVSGANLKGANDITILDVDKTNIYELINTCDFHLTKGSTCGLEALYFRKKSIIYEEIIGTSLFRINYPFIESLIYATTPQEIIEALETDNKPNENDIEQLFASESDIKFNLFLHKLFNEKFDKTA